MNTTTTTTTLSIDGMTCGHCVARVSRALSSVPGVEARSVAIGSAEVSAADPAALAAALAALADAGYTAKATQTTDAPKRGGCCGGKTSCCG